MPKTNDIRRQYERLGCETGWQESDPCRDSDFRSRANPHRLTRDLLQDMKMSVMKQELIRQGKLIDMLLCLVDPEDVRAALQLQELTPTEADWSAIAAKSCPPQELKGVQEEKPW